MSLTEEWLAAGPVEPCFDSDRLRAALGALDASEVDALVKGFPPGQAPLSLGAIAGRAWNLLSDDLPFPVAVLRRSSIEHNARWMRAYQERQGVSLAPHAKTTMAPHLWALQAGAACWGLTVATIQQARVASAFGCRNIILANQPMGHANLAGLMELHRAVPERRIMVFVESEAGAKALVGALRGCGCERPLEVMLELGMTGGRAGCRDIGHVDRLLDALAGERDRLRLVGIAGFEGIVAGAGDPRLEGFLSLLGEAALLADRRNVFAGSEVLLSAGGSAYFDLVTERLKAIRLSRTARIVLRSGCYLTHDSRHYERAQSEMLARSPGQFEGSDRLRPSLFVWAMVQARPEPGLAILTMGKRDAGFDIDLPQPVWRYRRHKMTRPAALTGAEIFSLNDQHGYMRVAPDADIAIGDLVGCGISHPCTTFDHWRLLHVVDDEWTSVGAILTFF